MIGMKIGELFETKGSNLSRGGVPEFFRGTKKMAANPVSVADMTLWFGKKKHLRNTSLFEY
jgi:hypothetical protein